MYNSKLCHTLREWDELKKIKAFNHPIAATLTFNQDFTRNATENTINSFFHSLNITVFRNAYKRHDKRIKAFGVFEGGDGTDKQGHYHYIMETPYQMTVEHFCFNIQTIWARKRYTGQYFNTIKPLLSIDDVENYLDYITKLNSKGGNYMDAIDMKNINL